MSAGFRLNGKVSVVTGAGRGNDRAVAEAMASAGAQVIGKVIAESGGGAILNITSNAADRGGNRIISYGASKGGSGV